jgi:hypothetical protein
MKMTLLFVLILWAAQSSAQKPIVIPPVATQSMSSEMGFELTYPSDWVVTNLNPLFPPIKKNLLEKNATNEDYKQRASCLQILFTAEVGQPRSRFTVMGEPTQCTGGALTLKTYAVGTMTSLRKKYLLSETESGTYSIKGLQFWAMRTKASPIDHPGESEIIEYIGTVLPKGVVFWTAYCKDQKAQSEFEHADLHLANGGETELVPAGAFQNR